MQSGKKNIGITEGTESTEDTEQQEEKKKPIA